MINLSLILKTVDNNESFFICFKLTLQNLLIIESCHFTMNMLSNRKEQRSAYFLVGFLCFSHDILENALLNAVSIDLVFKLMYQIPQQT